MRVCRGLSLQPVTLLERFAGWIDSHSPRVVEEKLGDDEVWHLQKKFLEFCFIEQGKKRLLPLALDLVDYHHHYAAALMAVPPDLPTERELVALDLGGARLTLAPSTRMARFSYEIIDILESGEVELSEFIRCFKKISSCAVIYPRGGEVMTESLAKPFFGLLEQLDGQRTVAEVVKKMAMDQEEALSFLEFAVAEGVVIMCNGASI